ncbi:hypothetical protein WA577_000508 [Blastocystis sp. JDR]
MTIKRGRNHKSTRPAAPPAIKDTATLIKKAQDCIDKLDPQGALIFLREALALEPENIQVIDLTASTMMDAGDDENAFPLLVKSAQMDPEHNFEKWMYLGQLQSGNDAVTCYRKGIQILETELSAMPEGDDKKMLLNRLCGAYCSIGELYMTDL